MERLNWHASCVAINGRGLLIRGKSGAGKSSLALELMAYGADLVADDRTELWRLGDQVLAASPAALRGLIEARGIGILRVPAAERAEITLIVDLDLRECNRLPPLRHMTVLGTRVPLVHGAENAHLAPALLQYLRHHRQH